MCARSLPLVYSFWNAQDVFFFSSLRDVQYPKMNKSVNDCGHVTTIELQTLGLHVNTRTPETHI